MAATPKIYKTLCVKFDSTLDLDLKRFILRASHATLE